jgi:hypothetical protein
MKSEHCQSSRAEWIVNYKRRPSLHMAPATRNEVKTTWLLGREWG